MEEIWKPIKGFEGKYEVSSLGRVKGLKRKVRCRNGYRNVKEKVLKPWINCKGYKIVGLGRKCSMPIHRLVLEMFIENIYFKPWCNHKDGNKLNNCVDNLEWCTPSENNFHFGEKCSWSKLNEKQIRIIKHIKNIPNHISSITMGEIFGVHPRHIRAIYEGKYWKHIII